MALIKTVNLYFSYKTHGGDTVDVLKNINLTIFPGELIAIQGPSGSGKSTLLYILTGLLTPTSGQVFIDGKNISEMNDYELSVFRNQYFGFIFQQFYLLPKLNVLENVLLPSQYPSEIENNISKYGKAQLLLEQVGLHDRSQRYPNQLSGGQQQRVAIARALLNDPALVFADEPTGSLDTKTSQHIVEILKKAHQAGCCVVIITHDPEVSRQCDRVIQVRDGVIDHETPSVTGKFDSVKEFTAPPFIKNYFLLFKKLSPQALKNLWQHKTRTFLTMLGIIIGVASVLSMTSIGAFTKQKILESYNEVGVNTFRFDGYTNWDLTATDSVTTPFLGFDWKNDEGKLRKTFPQIRRMSPVIMGYEGNLSYGGRNIDSEVRILGINSEGFELLNREFILGKKFSPFHIEARTPVCVIGYDIFQRLYKNTNPVGTILQVSTSSSNFGCKITGVLKSQTTSKEWNKPNMQIFFPHTFIKELLEPWYGQLRQIMIQVEPGHDVERTAEAVKIYYTKRYGKAGKFIIGSDSVLIAQMNKFLNLFSILLGAIAMVSLTVGGIGITNMMLVSISERLKEIGIRKAFGASRLSVRVQFLIESIYVCLFAGILGLIIGFILYQGAIYGASRLIPKLVFEWYINPTSFLLSFASIFIVGILSGLIPAMKAEKLEVLDALRND